MWSAFEVFTYVEIDLGGYVPALGGYELALGGYGTAHGGYGSGFCSYVR